jgi:acetylornithine deacetylase/succinyl-diaminopimelate desuccinylase-like protein
MNYIEQLAKRPSVQAALQSFNDKLEQIVALAIAVQQVPAPTFAEAERAAFVQSHFETLGLVDLFQDELCNVYGRYPSTDPQHPPLIISAHTDTVFAADTDLTIRHEPPLIYGPGLGDNATGVAGILWLAQTLSDFGLQPAADCWFVANVGEEGLGDLRGMRAVVDHFGDQATYIVVEGGLFGQIAHQAIGVRRFRIQVKAPGGHSWGSFGNASAIHELGRIITNISYITVPAEPKTTYNVGVIEGGTTINSIAQTAHLLLDLRSEDETELARLVQTVKRIVAKANGGRAGRSDGVTITMELIGNRPAGQISREAALVQWAEAALRVVGCEEISYIGGSTDANIPLSRGLTAVCIGLTHSGNAHRLDEYINPTHLPQGLGQLLLLTLAAANWQN